LRIIRPFVYVREKDLRNFAEQNKLPIIAENCPACFEAPKERQRMKQILAQQELNFPCLFNSLLSAIKPILSIDRCKLSIKMLSEYSMHLIRKNETVYKEMLDNLNSSTQQTEYDETRDIDHDY
jgi:tRNA(Ile)-lysidine synthase TilS/MesJ